jgi:hypothetical protein
MVGTSNIQGNDLILLLKNDINKLFTMKKLSQIRLFFIIYFLLKFILDILGWGMNSDVLNNTQIYGISNPDLLRITVYIIVFIVDALLFAIGLWLIHQLLQRKSWARIVLLVIGWLAMIDGFFSTVLSNRVGAYLSYFIDASHWSRIQYLDRLTDILGFIFWGYLIYLLQFDNQTKNLFQSSNDQDIPQV